MFFIAALLLFYVLAYFARKLVKRFYPQRRWIGRGFVTGSLIYVTVFFLFVVVVRKNPGALVGLEGINLTLSVWVNFVTYGLIALLLTLLIYLREKRKKQVLLDAVLGMVAIGFYSYAALQVYFQLVLTRVSM